MSNARLSLPVKQTDVVIVWRGSPLDPAGCLIFCYFDWKTALDLISKFLSWESSDPQFEIPPTPPQNEVLDLHLWWYVRMWDGQDSGSMSREWCVWEQRLGGKVEGEVTCGSGNQLRFILSLHSQTKITDGNVEKNVYRWHLCAFHCWFWVRI